MSDTPMIDTLLQLAAGNQRVASILPRYRDELAAEPDDGFIARTIRPDGVSVGVSCSVAADTLRALATALDELGEEVFNRACRIARERLGNNPEL